LQQERGYPLGELLPAPSWRGGVEGALLGAVLLAWTLHGHVLANVASFAPYLA